MVHDASDNGLTGVPEVGAKSILIGDGKQQGTDDYLHVNGDMLLTQKIK